MNNPETIKRLAGQYYAKLDAIYEEMIAVEVSGHTENWLQAETKLNEALEFLDHIVETGE